MIDNHPIPPFSQRCTSLEPKRGDKTHHIPFVVTRFLVNIFMITFLKLVFGVHLSCCITICVRRSWWTWATAFRKTGRLSTPRMTCWWKLIGRCWRALQRRHRILLWMLPGRGPLWSAVVRCGLLWFGVLEPKGQKALDQTNRGVGVRCVPSDSLT